MGVDPMARSGHLTDLGLEVLALDALGARPRRRAVQHLQVCDVCRSRWVGLAGPVPAQAPPPRWRMAAGGLLAAAAVLAAVGRVEPPAYTAKGGLGFEVWVHDGQAAHLLAPTEPVSPDQRLGFRVDVADAAYVRVLSVDRDGDWSAIFPAEHAPAAWLTPEHGDDLLDVAVRLDPSPGAETFAAVACPHDVSHRAARDRIDGNPGDCQIETWTVQRAEAP